MYITQEVIAYTRIIQNADSSHVQLKKKRYNGRYIRILHSFPYKVDSICLVFVARICMIGLQSNDHTTLVLRELDNVTHREG